MSRLFYLLIATLCASGSHQISSGERIGCSSPRLRRHVKIEWSIIADEHDHQREEYPEGSAVWFGCDAGYDLLGSKNSTCKAGKWLEDDTECLLEVAEGSLSQMSAQADEITGAYLAADGNPQTCVSFSRNEKRLVWFVDTTQAFRVRAVRILTQHSLPNATIEIRVGPRNPSTGSKFNKLCTRQQLSSLDGDSKDFRCDDDTAIGRYVSILIMEPGDHHVSLCEVSVYSDSGLSVDDACPPMNSMVSENASYVFENHCVQFLGQNTYDNASLLCELHGGTLVTPTSRDFQNFLDYHVLKFFESSFEQVLVSFWVNAERVNGSDSWVNGSGTAIQGVQIKTDTKEQCLVSENRSWHTESCNKQHQVICISAPISCGSPSLPESSSLRKEPGYKLPVNQSVSFDCEPGFQASVNSITCFSNGSLSEEPLCAREATKLSFSLKISNFLRSFSLFANLSARALQAVVAALGIALATLLSALCACCFCLCQKRQAKKMPEELHLSLISFSVHMRDLPLNTSDRLFKTPENEKTKSRVDTQA